jgi:hypothetical protein
VRLQKKSREMVFGYGWKFGRREIEAAILFSVHLLGGEKMEGEK